jgi:hypothetical protein
MTAENVELVPRFYAFRCEPERITPVGRNVVVVAKSTGTSDGQVVRVRLFGDVKRALAAADAD